MMNSVVTLKNGLTILVAVISFCFFFILYQSYWSHNIPIINIETYMISAVRQHNSVEVEYTRDFTVTRDISVIIERNVMHSGSGLTFDTPTVHRVYRPGRYSAHRIIVLPEGMPDGNYVYRTNIIWQPKGSIEDHEFSFKDEPFIMPTKLK